MPQITVDIPQGHFRISEQNGMIVRTTWGRGENEPTPLLNEAAKQLRDYFAGNRRDFDLPLQPHGPAMHQQVWQAMLAIPFGKTRSYGDLAQALNTCARAVGGACGANPIPIFIPCHRVLAANGEIGGFSGGQGVVTKRELLVLEGAIAEQLSLI
ncbi:MAG: methylated-DNA--[protein]-cysteine S-methyltransferase [Pseudomonadota bacterium]